MSGLLKVTRFLRLLLLDQIFFDKFLIQSHRLGFHIVVIHWRWKVYNNCNYMKTSLVFKPNAHGEHFTRTLPNNCVFPKLFVVCGLEKHEQSCSDEMFAISNMFDFEEHSDYENTVCLPSAV